MNKCLTLMKIQLHGLLGLGKLRYASTSKERTRALLFCLLVVLICAVMLLYSGLIAYAFFMMEMTEVLPSMTLLLTALIIVVFTTLKASGVLFGFLDYDMVMALPIPTGTLVLSRVLSLYLMDLLFAFAAMGPSMIVFCIANSASVGTVLMYLLGILLAPALPVTLAVVLGAIFTALSARLRRGNLLLVLLTMLFVAGVFYFTYQIQFIPPEELEDMAMQLLLGIRSWYPPSVLLQTALWQGSIVSFLGFATLSLGPLWLFTVVLGKYYGKINTLLQSRGGKRSAVRMDNRARSPIAAMVQKELRYLFSTTTYLLNSCFGLVMMLLAGVAVLLIPDATIRMYVQVPGLMEIITVFAPLALCFLSAMSNTTAASLSLEGRNRWILYSAPVSHWDILWAKLLCNYILVAPVCLVSSLLFAIRLRPDPVGIALLFAMPLCYGLFMAPFGLVMNLTYPRFDWTSEHQVVKQGAATFITIFTGMFLVLVPGGIMVAKQDISYVVQYATVALLLAGTVVLMLRLRKTALYL